MRGLLDRLFDLWLEPVGQRDDPEAAFRKLYADPVSVNGAPMAVASLVERARSLQRSFTGLKIEIVDQVETPDRIAVAFYMRGRHVGRCSPRSARLPRPAARWRSVRSTF